MAKNKTFEFCPRCHTVNLKIMEVSEERRVWYQNGLGKLQEPKAGVHEHGDVLRTLAQCQNPECGHIWVIRGITEASELPNWFDKVVGSIPEAPAPPPTVADIALDDEEEETDEVVPARPSREPKEPITYFDENGVPIVKKRRGRPAKAKEVAVKVSLETTEEETDTEVDIIKSAIEDKIVEGEPVKRKRGRPKKVAA